MAMGRLILASRITLRRPIGVSAASTAAARRVDERSHFLAARGRSMARRAPGICQSVTRRPSPLFSRFSAASSLSYSCICCSRLAAAVVAPAKSGIESTPRTSSFEAPRARLASRVHRLSNAAAAILRFHGSPSDWRTLDRAPGTQGAGPD